MGNTAAQGQATLFDLEAVEALEVEPMEHAEPTADDMAELEALETELEAEAATEVRHGYGVSEWLDVMAEQRALRDGVTRTLASARVLEDRRRTKAQAKADKAAQLAERRARIASGQATIQDLKTTRLYRLMERLTTATRTRGAVFTLADAESLTVSRVIWVKGQGKTVQAVGRITASGTRWTWRTEDGRKTVSATQLETLLNTELPERTDTLMPRKYRDVLRTHRAKNRSVVDHVGERAVKGNGHLEDADLITYPKLAQVVTTAGRPSRQGQRGGSALTDAERRESDRLRQAAYRAWVKAGRPERTTA